MRKAIYTCPQKFLVKDVSKHQFSNSKRVMPNGDVCQPKDLNNIIQQFRTLKIPQDLPEGHVFTFKAKCDDINPSSYKHEKGLDAVMVTCYGQFVGFLYPGEELDETFIVQSIDPCAEQPIGNGCYVAKEIEVDTTKKEVQYISPYDDKEIKAMLKLK